MLAVVSSQGMRVSEKGEMKVLPLALTPKGPLVRTKSIEFKDPAELDRDMINISTAIALAKKQSPRGNSPRIETRARTSSLSREPIVPDLLFDATQQ